MERHSVNEGVAGEEDMASDRDPRNKPHNSPHSSFTGGRPTGGYQAGRRQDWDFEGKTQRGRKTWTLTWQSE